MPLSPEVQAEIDAYVLTLLKKMRIFELQPNTDFGDVSLMDEIALAMHSVNKTVRCDLLTLKAILTTGGSGTIEPVLTGATIIHDVTPAEAGTDTVSEPALAGKTFFLRLEGRPVAPSDFEILNAGGWKMLGGYELQEGQRFDADVYELQNTGGIPGGTLSSSFFAGEVGPINANTVLSPVNEMNKLVKLRAGGAKVTLTLPDIATVSPNAFVCIDATIGNDWQNKIVTSLGQFIYYGNTSDTEIYIGPGEVFWLYRGSDGWYDLKGVWEAYKDLCIPKPVFAAGQNQLVLNGTLKNRADYPRAWKRANALGAAIVSDVLWSTAQVYEKDGVFTTGVPAAPYNTVPTPYRGKFSTGDGASNFRVPNFRDIVIRGLTNEAGGTGVNYRYQNTAGGFQLNEFKEHRHGVNTGGADGGADPGKSLIRQNYNGDNFQNGSSTYGGYIEEVGGSETRMDNVGMIWVINV